MRIELIGIRYLASR